MSLPQGSPRLPSPPPPAEIQLGPKSPSLNANQMDEKAVFDAYSKRRIHPGTKAEDMAAGPPLVPLDQLDSAFQLQEHLAALHYHHTAHNTKPITRAAAAQLTQAPPGTNRTLWLHELCRFLIAQCNDLIVGFLFDTPPCSATTCPEMRASEWQFLCAVHEQPKSCCAIDYCCHTLDWAANVVTNPKLFPSRFVLLDGHDKSAVLKSLINVFRRLHRIFAHAWFQHRTVFWKVESQTGLYAFFKTVCDINDLLPAENYKLPPEAEGLEPEAPVKDEKRVTVSAIAKPPHSQHGGSLADQEDDRSSLMARRSNTARHSSRPSTGSAVTTVIEEKEDEHSEVADKLQDVHVSAPQVAEEESEVEVPVIVEGGVMDEEPAPMDAQSVEIFDAANAPGYHQIAEEPADESQARTGGNEEVQDQPPTSPESPKEAAQQVEEPRAAAVDKTDSGTEADVDTTSVSSGSTVTPTVLRLLAEAAATIPERGKEEGKEKKEEKKEEGGVQGVLESPRVE
ncbi:Mob1/phocein [Xylariaceae sp. FL0594]|nr:Mob1/phocein [Xylariaceae sp. FL0594]